MGRLRYSANVQIAILENDHRRGRYGRIIACRHGPEGNRIAASLWNGDNRGACHVEELFNRSRSNNRPACQFGFSVYSQGHSDRNNRAAFRQAYISVKCNLVSGKAV